MEKVYDQYGRQLFTCALAVTRNPELAEDAIHEAFCRGFRQTAIPRNLKAYMFRSVRNAAIDQIRQRRRTTSLTEDFVFDSTASPGELAEQRQFKHLVAKALLKLSEDEREIADMRQRSIGTVASWYRRGLAKMKDHLEV
jgi:RNA polymerase sigma-70 factor (ECF subfamily)